MATTPQPEPVTAPDGPTSKGVAEQVVDLVLFAPIGVVDHLARWLPDAVVAGRRRAEQQVRTARWIGEMAVNVGRSKVAERLATLRRPASGAASTGRTDASVSVVDATATELVEPFADYDSLPAAELVAMLTRLTRDELQAVQTYEQAGRARRTVLARLDQLLAA